MGGKQPEKKKSGKSGSVLLLVLLLLVAAAIAGYFKPDLPVVGPLVSRWFHSAAAYHDQSGRWTVRVVNLTLDPEEFDQGENVDLQVVILKRGADGADTEIWNSEAFGERMAKVGRDSLTAAWADRPFTFQWNVGDRLVVQVWDQQGIDTRLCEWVTESSAKEFPLSGQHVFTLVKERTPRSAEGNSITFEAAREEAQP